MRRPKTAPSATADLRLTADRARVGYLRGSTSSLVRLVDPMGTSLLLSYERDSATCMRGVLRTARAIRALRAVHTEMDVQGRSVVAIALPRIQYVAVDLDTGELVAPQRPVFLDERLKRLQAVLRSGI